MPTGPQGQKGPAGVIGCTVKVAKIPTGEIEENILRQIRTLPTKASPMLHLKSIRKYLLIQRGGGKSRRGTAPRLNLTRHPALFEGDAGPFSHPWRLGPPTPATAPCPVCSRLKLQAIGNSLYMSIHMPDFSHKNAIA